MWHNENLWNSSIQCVIDSGNLTVTKHSLIHACLQQSYFPLLHHSITPSLSIAPSILPHLLLRKQCAKMWHHQHNNGISLEFATKRSDRFCEIRTFFSSINISFLFPPNKNRRLRQRWRFRFQFAWFRCYLFVCKCQWIPKFDSSLDSLHFSKKLVLPFHQLCCLSRQLNLLS